MGQSQFEFDIHKGLNLKHVVPKYEINSFINNN
jgi:hypothetical protein